MLAGGVQRSASVRRELPSAYWPTAVQASARSGDGVQLPPATLSLGRIVQLTPFHSSTSGPELEPPTAKQTRLAGTTPRSGS